ncbi:FkbM family methyltransferase [uncultured Selenomonas sp.]|uniref:FkbM family methyltransferase n=1 Tax=uncultured Selenomonas sp. TaxID=159275 RepID=UPI00258F774F|nr:FkbM family methyltransferase [uncultured Selenomonas sp.]
MKASRLYEEYQDGKIEKHLYWQMMRERLLPLLEIQAQLINSTKNISVEITKDDIILNVDGVRFSFDFNQSISRAETIVALGGNPEQTDFDLLVSFLKDGDVVFDIGANVGVVSLMFVHDHPQIGAVYAFEPLPPTYARLQHNLRLNGNPSKIIAENLGISDKQGRFDFYLTGADEAASLIPNRDAYYLKESVNGHFTGRERFEKIPCRVTTLDEYVRQHPLKHIDLMKVDVEGNEKNVFREGTSTIKTYQPVIYCELLRKHAKRFGYHPNEVIALLADLGYQCFCHAGNRLLPFTVMTDETVETNFFFLHTEKHRELIQRFH